MHRLALICICLLPVSAVGQSPSCADPRTVQLIKQIFAESIERKSAGFPVQDLAARINALIPVSVRSIRTAEIERTISKHYCEGVLEVRLPAKSAALLTSPRAQALLAQSPETRTIRTTGNTVSQTVRFTSQLTDDRKEHYVEVGGLQTIVDLVFQFVALEVDEQLAAESSAATAPRVSQPKAASATERSNVAGPSTQATWKPSFDCSKASIYSEKAICRDSLLGKLDGALSENYKHILAANIGEGARNDLRATQRTWLSERNKCTNSECLVAVYRKRIDEVCEYPVISGIHPACASSDDVK